MSALTTSLLQLPSGLRTITRTTRRCGLDRLAIGATLGNCRLVDDVSAAFSRIQACRQMTLFENCVLLLFLAKLLLHSLYPSLHPVMLLENVKYLAIKPGQLSPHLQESVRHKSLRLLDFLRLRAHRTQLLLSPCAPE